MKRSQKTKQFMRTPWGVPNEPKSKLDRGRLFPNFFFFTPDPLCIKLFKKQNKKT